MAICPCPLGVHGQAGEINARIVRISEGRAMLGKVSAKRSGSSEKPVIKSKRLLALGSIQ